MVETVSWLVRVHVSHSGASDFSRVKLEEDSIDVFETLDVCVDEILELDHPPVGTSTITVTVVVVAKGTSELTSTELEELEELKELELDSIRLDFSELEELSLASVGTSTSTVIVTVGPSVS